jgi:N-acetylneuraminic acid mutarotase
VLALLLVAGGVAAAGLGPNLPGPPIRVALGLADAAARSCPNGPGPSMLPSGTAAATQWTPAFTFDDAVDEMQGTVLGDSILLLGGVGTSRWGERYESARNVYRIDPRRGTWKQETALPDALDHPLVVTYRGDVYVVGGYEDGVATDDVWRYSPADGSWTERAPLRLARGGMAGGVIGDELYVAGGAASYANPDARDAVPPGYDSVEIYDFAADRWRPGPRMPTARHHAGSAVLDGKLYVAGGRRPGDTSMDVVERLDPAAGTWERLPPLPLGVGSVAAFTADGQMVVVGGSDALQKWVTPATWAYRPGATTWRRLADLRVPRHSLAAFVVGERAYALAGAPCAGHGSTTAVEQLPLDAVH